MKDKMKFFIYLKGDFSPKNVIEIFCCCDTQF
jgi:hypothetical protein